MLGRGSFRVARLVNGVVYKVEYPEYNYLTGAEVSPITQSYLNRKEHEIAVRARRYVKRKGLDLVYIPEVSMFDVGVDSVIAMEYIAGRRLDYTDNSYRKARSQLFMLGFVDMHSDNYRIDYLGRACPIDMGSPRRGSPDVRCLALPDIAIRDHRRGRHKGERLDDYGQCWLCSQAGAFDD